MRDLRTAATTADVPFFVKQLGAVWSQEAGHGRSHGGEIDGFPEDLRIRQMPTAESALQLRAS